MRRRVLPLMAALISALLPLGPALATDEPTGPPECGEFGGVVCQGWFTDDAGVVEDDQRVEDAIDRLVGRYGNDIAMIIVEDSGESAPLEFANDLGNAWGVGDAEQQDGIVLLVDLAERETVMTTGPGISLPESAITGAADSFFGGGDFEGGMLALVGRLEQELAAVEGGGTGDSGGGVGGESDGGEQGGGGSGLVILGIVGMVGVIGIGAGVWSKRRNEDTVERERRSRLIDDDLAALEPAGHELFQIIDYAVEQAATTADVGVTVIVPVLAQIQQGLPVTDGDAVDTALGNALAVAIDRDRLVAENEVPLELRAADERTILEEAVQAAAGEALDVAPRNDDLFQVRRNDVQRLVQSLRPHRVAAARQRLATTVANKLVATPLGSVTLTDGGERFLRASPALDQNATTSQAVDELAGVYATAVKKTDRLGTLYDKLPDSTARPAVAAALADLEDDIDTAVERYEHVRSALGEQGSALVADGLELPAVAALLLMNNDDADVAEFVAAYNANRAASYDPGTAVELALAGLRTPAEIDHVRTEAKNLDLPVSITAALLRRRDDGPEVYKAMLEQLAAHEVSAESRQTIAGVLAISLEPAQALRRWAEARTALGDLGLTGAYADVAAAFGASDPRGPRVFALAYAAQRQALARSSVDDADRFAPELAHEGTAGQSDSWTGEPIPPGLAHFDPFTLLFYHWIITRGRHGTFGWEPMYGEHSWSDDRDSWWGGSGGFGGWGGGGGFSGGGGSSWGGGSWGGSGGFGGFGGGGGFSGGGGSGW